MSATLFWQALRPGSVIDVVAPSGALPATESLGLITQRLVDQLQAWGLQVRMPANLLGADLLSANSDALRLQHLLTALMAQDSQAVWCLRGGYGCTRLIPALAKVPKPTTAKLFIGFSDITALHIFLQQQWSWATLHGASLRQISQPEFPLACRETLREVIFGTSNTLRYKPLLYLNQVFPETETIDSTITGGNLCLVEASLGTPWQLQTAGKIIFLEEVNERGYRVDRMLMHCQQAGLFDQAQAVLMGDFTGGAEPDGSNLIAAVLKRFAANLKIPVVQYPGIGHGDANYPLPLNTPARLHLAQHELVVTVGSQAFNVGTPLDSESETKQAEIL